MTFGYFSSQKSNAPPAGVQIKSFVKLAPPLGDCKPGHVHLPEGNCKPRPVYKAPLRRANYPQMLPAEPNERSFSYGHG